MRQKSFVFTALLLLFCLTTIQPVSAQEKEKKTYFASPTIEASGSFNFAIYNKNDVKAIGITRKLLGSAGLFLGCDMKMPHGILMLQYGFLISNNNFIYGDNFQRLAFNSLALDMPLVVGYALRLSNSYSLSFSGGYVTKNIFKYDLGFIEGHKPIYAFGMYGAIGFCYHASPNFTLRVEPFFEYFWMTPDYYGQLDYMAPAIVGLRMALKYNILKLAQ